MSDLEVGSTWVRNETGQMFRLASGPAGSHGWVMLRSLDTDRPREVSVNGLRSKYTPLSPGTAKGPDGE